jgi:hypothetical protein
MERRGDRPDRKLCRGAIAFTLLGGLVLSAVGCARQDAIEAAAVGQAEAPVVTVHTLTSRTRYPHAATPAAAPAETPKPRPRRRRRPRSPRAVTPPPATPAVATEATPPTEKPAAAAGAPETSPKAAAAGKSPEAGPAVPEHVIEPKAPNRDATPTPEAPPKAPPVDGKPDQ